MKVASAVFAVVLGSVGGPVAASGLGAHPVAPVDMTQSAPDIVGEWSFTTVSPLGEQTNVMAISKEGDGLKAVAKGAQGEAPYDKVELAGNVVTIVLTINYENSPMVITYHGTVEGTGMSGDADFGGLAQGSWSAVRK